MNPTTLWMVAGVFFCLMEFFLPTAFIETTLGASAFVVALISLVVPQFSVQVVLWLIFSVAFIFLLRRFMPKPVDYSSVSYIREAHTITEIPPGRVGRVLYEGSSWQARCEDAGMTIAPDQPVYVVRRQGNTLYVLPENLLHA